jgi:hypothetical protein
MALAEKSGGPYGWTMPSNGFPQPLLQKSVPPLCPTIELLQSSGFENLYQVRIMLTKAFRRFN